MEEIIRLRRATVDEHIREENAHNWPAVYDTFVPDESAFYDVVPPHAHLAGQTLQAPRVRLRRFHSLPLAMQCSQTSTLPGFQQRSRSKLQILKDFCAAIYAVPELLPRISIGSITLDHNSIAPLFGRAPDVLLIRRLVYIQPQQFALRRHSR